MTTPLDPPLPVAEVRELLESVVRDLQPILWSAPEEVTRAELRAMAAALRGLAARADVLAAPTPREVALIRFVGGG